MGDISAVPPVTVVVAANSSELLESNLLASPDIRGLHPHQVLIQWGFNSAAKAYNDAIERSINDLMVFAHQDVLLPARWLSQLARALDYLEANDPRWGVLGCFGRAHDGSSWGHVYSSGRGVIGRPLKQPVSIQTLDEIVLILRKSSDLRFDDSLPHFHLYGTDICLAAAKRGMKSYAIPAFCIHNTQQNLILPSEFYQSYKHVRKVWKRYLPIHTTCLKVSKSNLPLYTRRLHEAYLRHVRRREIGAVRIKNAQTLLEQFRVLSEQ